jgi:hypothetical protein
MVLSNTLYCSSSGFNLLLNRHYMKQLILVDTSLIGEARPPLVLPSSTRLGAHPADARLRFWEADKTTLNHLRHQLLGMQPYFLNNMTTSLISHWSPSLQKPLIADFFNIIFFNFAKDSLPKLGYIHHSAWRLQNQPSCATTAAGMAALTVVAHGGQPNRCVLRRWAMAVAGCGGGMRPPWATTVDPPNRRWWRQ